MTRINRVHCVLLAFALLIWVVAATKMIGDARTHLAEINAERVHAGR